MMVRAITKCYYTALGRCVIALGRCVIAKCYYTAHADAPSRDGGALPTAFANLVNLQPS